MPKYKGSPLLQITAAGVISSKKGVLTHLLSYIRESFRSRNHCHLDSHVLETFQIHLGDLVISDDMVDFTHIAYLAEALLAELAAIDQKNRLL